MTHFDQLVKARLSEIRDIARSSDLHLTGKAQRIGAGETFEHGHRFRGGFRKSFPELKGLPERYTPAAVAGAIERGKGVIYNRVRDAVADGVAYYTPRPRKRSPEKPTVAPHKKLTAKCKACGRPHGKGSHAFHGKGSFLRTHLFPFKSNRSVIKGAAMATARRNGTRTRTSTTTDALTKDNATLTITGNGNVVHQKRNPGRNQGVVIYGRILRIEAQKTQPHICDAACKRANHCYFHNFKPGSVIIGLPDGSLIVRKK